MVYKDELLESVLGDIYEKFQERAANDQLQKAKLLYVIEGLGLVRLYAYQKNKKNFDLNPFIMWRNYILIAWRNLLKEKTYSLLNIVGLAVGLASVLVIYRFIDFELSYDKFHSNHKAIYRIGEEFDDDAQRVRSAMSHAPVAEILANQVAGVKNVIRIYPQSAFISADKQTKYRENLFCFADSLFFDTFSFEPIAGSLSDALNSPFSVVLTEKMANKYFGTTDIIGKEIQFEDETKSYVYNITGVIKNVPQNSHLTFNFIASFSTLEKTMSWYKSWHYPAMYIYLSAEENTSSSELYSNIQKGIDTHQPDYVKEEKRAYVLQPLTSIHLHSNLEFEWEANSHYRYIQIFGWLGLFILLIACINFMNMATAQATKRALEIGLRKTLGGLKSQLVYQFISETLVYVTIAFLISLVISEIALKFLLSELINKDLSLFIFLHWTHALIGIGFIIIVALIAGLYPAVYLSTLHPTHAIKSGIADRGRSNLRKGLVTFQFIISGILICATIIIASQINYLQNKNLGFDKELIVSIGLTDRYAQANYTKLKEDLLKESSVVSAGLSSALPANGTFHGFDVKIEGQKDTEGINIKTLGTDEDFIKTYGLTILSGRDFSKEIITDQTEAFILNEAAALKFGWKNPVGKDFEMTIYTGKPVLRKGKVIAVVKDFNFQSLHNAVEPLVMYINKHPYYAEFLSVRMQPGNLKSAVNLLQKKWKDFNPEKPLEYNFLDDGLKKLYQNEMKANWIFTIFTIISVAISALGLFALASYSASKRAKEMGIRKVFGASINQILLLQAKEYVIIILLANAIVIPACWYWAKGWLSNFAYHIMINPLMFLATVLISLILAMATVAFHSIKLAGQNPVYTIRHE
jgi:putative ABC transport system permease protein